MINRLVTPVFFEFKTRRQKREWYSGKLHVRAVVVAWLFAIVSKLIFGKKLFVTDIYRTQEENDKIYGWYLGCGRKRKYSVHSYWRGIDFRTLDIDGDKRPPRYTKEQAETLKNIGNAFPYDPDRPDLKTVVYGNGRHKDHFHIQAFPVK